MKTFSLSILILFFSRLVYSQCDAPVLESWSVTDTINYTVNFTPPEGSESYIMTVSYIAGIIDSAALPPLVITDNTVTGINTVTFTINNPENLSLEVLYITHFVVELSASCENSEQSAINKFYISPVSMANDPAIDLGDNYFMPFVPIIDVFPSQLDPIETTLSIPISGFSHNIEDLSVFIDLSLVVFNYNISLTSPEGTTAQILSPQGYQPYLSLSISALFENNAPPFQIDTLHRTEGLFSPYDSFSIFEGENPNGIWTLTIISTPSVTLNTESIHHGMLLGVALIISPCLATLQGKVYYDFNSNATQELDEPSFANAIIYNSLTNREYISSSEGEYDMCNPAGEGVISLENPPGYYTSSNISYTLNSGDYLSNLDFNLVPMEGIEDLKVDIFPTEVIRPGFSSEYAIYYENVGTECVDNVEINVELDELLEITGASGSNVSYSSNSAVAALSEICPGENGTLFLSVYLSADAPINIQVTSTATILPIVEDENSSDNISLNQATVVGSYDPNDKGVSNETMSPDFLANSEPLKYLIRFQNTGTYQAERVVIIDTLDANLDINSFSLITASHNVDITRNGNIYTFEFDQIFLPDSTTNEPESHGFIRYQVKPTNGMIHGETIENTAYIFFDFNAPIITNTVSTMMDFSSGLTDITYEAKVYPNPATNEINLEWAPDAKINNIKVTDISGRVLTTFHVNGRHRVTIPIDNLSSGIYMFQFDGNAIVKPVVWMKK